MSSSSAWAFAGKYVSVTTYKGDGTAVATPVWFAQDGDRVLVRTGTSAGKTKRIRNNPQVEVAECTARGRLRGEPVGGVARVLSGAESDAAVRLINRKYRADLVIVRAVWFVQSALHVGRRRSTPVALEITPR